MGLSNTLRQTIAFAALETDDRGLLPLTTAREILAAAEVYPGAPVHEGRTPEESADVAVSHILHAAIVSLDSGPEALTHLTRLTFGKPLYDATTLIERYGVTMLPWLVGTTEAGIAKTKSWELEPALAMLGTEDAFEFLLKLRAIAFDDEPRKAPCGSVAQIAELDPKTSVDPRVTQAISLFLRQNPVVAARVIARRIAHDPKNKRRKPIGRELPETPDVLAALGGPIAPDPVTPKALLSRHAER